VRCFYHHDVDAVAVCKSCSRGLCPACAADVGSGVACRDRCETEVRAINEVIARNKTAYQKTEDAYMRNALFYAVLGALCLTGGFANYLGYALVLVPAGLVFLLAAFLQYSTARKFR
jgi:hypothetical protein